MFAEAWARVLPRVTGVGFRAVVYARATAVTHWRQPGEQMLREPFTGPRVSSPGHLVSHAGGSVGVGVGTGTRVGVGVAGGVGVGATVGVGVAVGRGVVVGRGVTVTVTVGVGCGPTGTPHVVHAAFTTTTRVRSAAALHFWNVPKSIAVSSVASTPRVGVVTRARYHSRNAALERRVQ